MHDACLGRTFARLQIPGPLARIAKPLKEFGPYLLIEMALPGGSLVAGTLWYLHGKSRAMATALVIAFVAFLIVGIPAQ
jgi:hypothetical protein